MAHRANRANSLPFSEKNTGLITKHGTIPSCINSACPPPITTFHLLPPPFGIINTRSVEDVRHATHPEGWCLWCWRWGFWGWWLSGGISCMCTLNFSSGPLFQERRHTFKECPIGASCIHRSEMINLNKVFSRALSQDFCSLWDGSHYHLKCLGINYRSFRCDYILLPYSYF